MTFSRGVFACEYICGMGICREMSVWVRVLDYVGMLVWRCVCMFVFVCECVCSVGMYAYEYLWANMFVLGCMSVV